MFNNHFKKRWKEEGKVGGGGGDDKAKALRGTKMAQRSGEGEDGKEGQRLHEEEGCLPWVLALVV